MCGIAGFTTHRPTHSKVEILHGIKSMLHHRGPDDFGWLSYGPSGVRSGSALPENASGTAFLLHRRLSILDLSKAGWQPMASPDGRYHITFNGEIYNYIEIRQELLAAGISFRSNSDTEVLLQAFAQWGRQCLTRLVGMFAFAILDSTNGTMFLARDFFGIKPLYYASWEEGIAFASEVKPLLSFAGVKRRANLGRIYDYLRYAQSDGGGESFFENVQQLPPGHYLEFDVRERQLPKPMPYWSLDIRPPLDITPEEAAKEIRRLFLKNVSIHLRSDVPVGAALSGGVDSCSILSAARIIAGPGQAIHAFSYMDEQSPKNEESWARMASEHAKAVIHPIRIGPYELQGLVEAVMESQQEPFGSTSICAQHAVFRVARENGIKVMLDGQGADEIFGGYNYFWGARLASLIRAGKFAEAWRVYRATPVSSQFRARTLPKDMARLSLPAGLVQQLTRATGSRLTPAWLHHAWFEKRHAADDMRYDLTGSPKERLKLSLKHALTVNPLPSLLRYEDRNSMAHSIESRVPFLTADLATFALSLPEHCLLKADGTTKSVLRDAMRGIVPDAILDRRDKIGFETPEGTWLVRLRPWLESILFSEKAERLPFLNAQAARQDFSAFVAGGPFHPYFWRLANVIDWSNRFEVVYDA